jgi:hypothetical protein
LNDWDLEGGRRIVLGGASLAGAFHNGQFPLSWNWRWATQVVEVGVGVELGRALERMKDMFDALWAPEVV